MPRPTGIGGTDGGAPLYAGQTSTVIRTHLRPGDRCQACLRRVPRTMLEFWLDQQGLTFSALGRLMCEEEPAIHEALRVARARALDRWPEGAKGPLVVTKNLIFRLNHQRPGWVPTTRLAQLVQASILRRSGLSVQHLQNRRPESEGYA